MADGENAIFSLFEWPHLNADRSEQSLQPFAFLCRGHGR